MLPLDIIDQTNPHDYIEMILGDLLADFSGQYTEYDLSPDGFKKLNSETPTEDIEKLLALSLPKRLKQQLRLVPPLDGMQGEMSREPRFDIGATVTWEDRAHYYKFTGDTSTYGTIAAIVRKGDSAYAALKALPSGLLNEVCDRNSRYHRYIVAVKREWFIQYFLPCVGVLEDKQ